MIRKLTARWSSSTLDLKKAKQQAKGSNASSADLSEGIDCPLFSGKTPTLGMSLGAFSAAGKFHKNEDVVVAPISLAEVLGDDMEFCELSLDDVIFTAVFDGHGGPDCATFMANALPLEIARMVNDADFRSFDELCVSSVVADAFANVEQDFKTLFPMSASGSCVCSALISGNSFLLAWLGDCRAVLKSGDSVVQLTEDHRTSNQAEFIRIINAGGQVLNDRIMGILAPTRAFGDNTLKRRYPEMISSVPSVMAFTIDEADVPRGQSILVLGSDGIFDAFPNSHVCTLASNALEVKGGDARSAARRIVEEAGKAHYDDMTACVIVWDHAKRLANGASACSSPANSTHSN